MTAPWGRGGRDEEGYEEEEKEEEVEEEEEEDRKGGTDLHIALRRGGGGCPGHQCGTRCCRGATPPGGRSR